MGSMGGKVNLLNFSFDKIIKDILEVEIGKLEYKNCK